MADTLPTPVPVVPVEPVSTDPARPGSQTSEFKLTLAAAVLGAVLTGMSASFTELHAALPNVSWIAGAVGLLAGAATFLLPLLKYIQGRTEVKVGQLRAAAAQSIALSSPK